MWDLKRLVHFKKKKKTFAEVFVRFHVVKLDSSFEDKTSWFDASIENYPKKYSLKLDKTLSLSHSMSQTIKCHYLKGYICKIHFFSP